MIYKNQQNNKKKTKEFKKRYFNAYLKIKIYIFAYL
jgi:hypothetical protein